jgi:prenyltransferase beta subunit
LVVKHQDDEAQDDNQEKEEDIANTYSDEDIISMVDQVLDQEDANKDGLVSYAEFRQAQDGEAHSKQTSDNAGQM